MEGVDDIAPFISLNTTPLNTSGWLLSSFSNSTRWPSCAKSSGSRREKKTASRYTSSRLPKSLRFCVAKGYAVQSELVKAFIKVFSERRSIMKKGSRTGYRSLPHSAVCSRICATPVESSGTVLSATMKTFSEESLLRCRCCAPVPGCSYSSTVRLRLGIGTARFKIKVLGCSLVTGAREGSLMCVVPILLC